MSRLYRPHIPLKVRCEVAERQLAAHPTIQCLHLTIDWSQTTDKYRLEHAMTLLARVWGCELKELRLDHDPPLAARAKSKWSSDGKTHYIPEANSPAHLAYRPHGPEHEHSHLIKTNVRGDHGQHPDRVLIKKARKLERGPRAQRSPPIRSRGFAKVKRPFPKRRP